MNSVFFYHFQIISAISVRSIDRFHWRKEGQAESRTHSINEFNLVNEVSNIDLEERMAFDSALSQCRISGLLIAIVKPCVNL